MPGKVWRGCGELGIQPRKGSIAIRPAGANAPGMLRVRPEWIILPIVAAACVLLFSHRSTAAPYHPKIAAEFLARGETVPPCPSDVANLWPKIADRIESMKSAGPADRPMFGAPNKFVAPSDTFKIAVLITQFQQDSVATTSGSGRFSIDGNGTDTSVGDTVRILLSRADTYYRAVSYGKLRLSYTVFDTRIVTVSDTVGNYAASTTNTKNLVKEVLLRVDTDVNFGAYDVVVVLHAGMATQISGRSGDMSAQLFDGLSDSYTDKQTQDTVTLGVIMPALPGPSPISAADSVYVLGLLCHELGHAFNLPDLYSTLAGSGGVGKWSIMSVGTYEGRPQGDSPVWMDPWCREFLSWSETVTLSADTHVIITRAESDSRIYKIRALAGVDTEYFLFEYRAPTIADVDTSLAPGMLIWHINNSIGTLTSNDVQRVDLYGRRRVDLVEADSSDVHTSTDSPGQPWPGTLKKSTFGDSTFPNSRPYTGVSARFEAEQINVIHGKAVMIVFFQDTPNRTWYVNDTSTTGDSYTYAVGNDTSGVGSRALPFQTVPRAMMKARAGDTIVIDAGLYGDTYVWVSSTETAAFKIDTNNLTIIGKDSASTVIDPPGSNSITTMYGIYADTQTGLVIKNIGVTGAYNGIHFLNIDSSDITGDSFSSNGSYGIYLSGSDTNTFSLNSLAFNALGCKLFASQNNSLSTTIITSHTYVGIELETGSHYNTIYGNRMDSNLSGVAVYNSSYTALNNNVLTASSSHGIRFGTSSYNTVRHNLLSSNEDAGLYLRDCTQTIVMMNTFDSNAKYQVWILGKSNGDTVQKNNLIPSASNKDSAILNQSSNPFDFSRNWWDTTDEVRIASIIYDTATTKNFRPYRLGMVDTKPGADTTAPHPPNGVTCTASTGYITLTWGIPVISEETNGGSVGYAGARVYRLTSADTTNWSNVANLVRVASSTETQWTDTTVSGGITYYYRLTSLDGNTIVNQSFFSDTKSVTASGGKWYVNDTYSSSADSFTTAGGSDTSYGDGSVSKPYRSVAKALQSAKSGDTIFVDAGVYGETYVHVSSAETAAFKIDTDNLTIIGKDSASTVIDPPGAGSITTMYGIYADTQSGLIIKNIGVTGAAIGIYFNNVDKSELIGDSVSSNANLGLYLAQGCDTNVLAHNAFASNLVGLKIAAGWNNSISTNVITLNASAGIDIDSGSNTNALYGNRLDSNAAGIVVQNSSYAELGNNVVRAGASHGIKLVSSSFLAVRHNLVSGNQDAGIYLRHCTQTLVMMNTFDSNAGYQVWLLGSTDGDTFQKNNIYPSSSSKDSGVFNQTNVAFDFSRNWWDTTDEVRIDTMISDTASTKKISFRPYRLGMVDTKPGGDTTAPFPPSGVTCTAATGTITVTWAIPGTQEETNGGSVGYAGARVYRLTSADTTNWANVANLVRVAGSTETQWTDTTVSNGTTYYYRLTSLDGSTPVNQSFFSDTRSATASSGAWYVNDTYSSSVDSFTTAGGSDTSYGQGTASKPYRSVAKALQSAKSGDTIFVDAGRYVETHVIVSSTETAVFKIDTDNLTIIGKDSNATVFDPPGDSSVNGLYGIFADTQSGLAIKNIGVTGAFEGIYFLNVDKSTVSGDSAGSCGNAGINFGQNSESNTLSGNQAAYNVYGFVLQNGRHNTVSSNVANNNKLYGISATSDAFDTYTNNLSDSNTSYGVYLFTSDTAIFTGNVATSNGNSGLLIDGAQNVLIARNTFDSNLGSGIECFDASAVTPSWISCTNNLIRYNRQYGVAMVPAARSTVRSSLIRGNVRAGVYLSGGDTVVILQNDITNSDTGVYVTGTGGGHVISKNNFLSNAVKHIYNQAAANLGSSHAISRNWFDTTDEIAIDTKVSDTVNAFRPYRLGPVDTAGGASDTTAPGLPASVSATADSIGQIAISWTIPTINEETNGGSVGYAGARIYRLTNRADTNNWANGANLGFIASSSATSWTDTGTSAGNTYYYRLTSIDGSTPVNQSFLTDTKYAKATRSIWYVNDTYNSSADSFTYGGGSDTSYGDGSVSKPYRSVAKALQSAKSGDTIFVDAGRYVETYVIVSSAETAVFSIDTDNITIIGKDSGATVFDPPGDSSVTGLYGIYADTQSGLIIKNIGITGAYDGMRFMNVDKSEIASDSVSSCGNIGILFWQKSDTNTIRGNQVGYNWNNAANGYGIDIESGSIHNTVTNNITSYNKSWGITIYNSNYDTVTDNTVDSNGGQGIYAFISDTVLIARNSVALSGKAGVQIDACQNVLVAQNILDSNVQSGIEITDESASSITNIVVCTGNVIRYNKQYGVAMSPARFSTIRHNLIRGNLRAGVFISSADTNIVSQNDITNSDTGIYLTGSTHGNVIVKNNFLNNAVKHVFNQSAVTGGADLSTLKTIARNWFDTADEIAIDTKVSDTVNAFRPYRLGPVDTHPGADTTAPGLPANVSLDTSVAGVIKLTWTIPTINEETNGGSVGYAGARVYRLTSADTTNWANISNLVRIGSSTETTWADTGVIFGNTYYYRLTSFDAATLVNQSFFTDTKGTRLTSQSTVRFYDDTAYSDEVDTYLTRDVVFIEVRDSDENRNSSAAETVTVTVYVGNGTAELGDTGGLIIDTETLILTESGIATAIFRCSAVELTDTRSPKVNDGIITWGRSDTIYVLYIDSNDINDTSWDTALALEIPTASRIQFFEDTAFSDDVDTYKTRDVLFVAVFDTDENRNPQRKDTVGITIQVGLNTNGSISDTEYVVLTESTETSGIFQSGVVHLADTATAFSNNNYLTWATSDTIHAVYLDIHGATSDSGFDTALLVDTTVQSYSGPTWYVNDSQTAGDFYTTGIGSDTDGVGSSVAPYRSVAKALQSAKSGDTIFVDAGLYNDTFMIVLTGSETAAIKIDTNNLWIIGKDSASTIIDPPGANSVSGLYGIYADSQSSMTIKNLAITGAYIGVHFVNVDTSFIQSDSVSGHGANGIYLINGCDSNHIDSNTATVNTGQGIYVIGGGYNSITSNLSNSNTAGAGIYLSGSIFNSLVNNTTGSNSQAGIYLAAGADTNVVRGNTASSNTQYGIYLYSGANNNRVIHNVVQSNTEYGIYLTTSVENLFFQNTIDNNIKYQIYIDGSSERDTFQKNNVKPSSTNPDSGVYNGSVNPSYKFTFTRNWWDTTDAYSINKLLTFSAGGSDSLPYTPFRLARVDTGIGADTTAPGVPGNVTLDTSVGSVIKVSWTIPTVSEETNGGTVGYAGARIYRLRSSPDTTHWASSSLLVWIAGITDTFWNDSGVIGGETYYYRLTSFDSATYVNQSFFSDTKGIRAETIYAGPKWYVNDTYSSSIDSFTYAAGSDTGSGDGSVSKPFRSAAKALQRAKSGDTVFIDAGLYNDTYVYVSPSETAAFKIDTDYMTIIGKDSASVVIDPPGRPWDTGVYGIFADTQTGLIIKNLGIIGAADGVHFFNVNASTVSGDSITGCGNSSYQGGIICLHSDTNTFSNNQIHFNSIGIYLFTNCDYNTITNNLAASDSIYGMIVTGASNTVSNNIVDTAGSTGILMELTLYNTVSGNVSRGSSNGLSFWSATQDTIQHNIATGNGIGLYLKSCTGLSISQDTWSSNSSHGISADTSSLLVIRSCAIRSNTYSGIRFQSSETSIVTQNDISGGDTGIWLTGASRNNVITKNNFLSNAVKHIYSQSALTRGDSQILTRNWFGTTDELAIDTKFSDTVSLFRPYRLGAVDTGIGADTTAPAPPTGFALDTATGGVVKLAWTIPTIQEDTNGGSLGYSGAKIYRTTARDTVNWADTSLLVRIAGSTDTTWSDTTVTAGAVYYYRMTSFDAASVVNQSFFTDTKASGTVQTDTAPKTWYVNDTYSSSTDSFTSAAGADTSWGEGTASKPYRSVAKVMQKVRSGDTILVDAGIYNDTYVIVSSSETAAFKIDTDNLLIVGKDSSSTIIDPPGTNSGSGLYGIYADTQTNLTIRGIGVIGATEGIYLVNIDSSTISHDSVSSCAYGLTLRYGSETNTVSHSSFSGNTLLGLNLTSATGNKIMDNFLNANSSYGLSLSDAHNNSIHRTVVRSSGAYGAYLTSSSGNIFVQNTFDSSAQYQIVIDQSSSSDTFSKNTIRTSSSNPDSAILSASSVTTNVFAFTRNWWGTTDEVTIRKMIAHPGGGDSIAFIPYRLSTVDTASGADTTAPGLPAGVTVTSSSGYVQVSWTIPSVSEETNGGSVGYSGLRVFRLTNTADSSNWANTGNLAFTATSSATSWTDTTVTVGSTYYYRLSSFDAATYVNHSFFTDTKSATATAQGTTWYVNDTYTSADSFTTAGGSDTGGSGTRSAPYRSVAKAMQSVKSGDTILVDAGLYADTYVHVTATETAAFKIDTNNLTIIGKDSNATVIDPPGASSITTMYGIYADTQTGLVIKNFGVTGAYDGVRFVNVDSSSIIADSFSSNGQYGLSLINGSDTNSIVHCMFNWNSWHGVYLSGSGDSLFNNTARSNSVFGINMDTSVNNIITDNDISANSYGGLELIACTQILVNRNVIRGNGQTGLVVLSSTQSRFLQNTFDSNAQYQVDIGGGSSSDTFEKNNFTTSSSNADSGVTTSHSITTNSFSFKRNYWKTTDEVSIRKKLNVSGGGDSIVFIPYRLDFVDTSAGADTTAPGLPAIVSLDTSTAGTIKVTWTIPTISEETNGGTVGYAGAKIYRLTSADTTNWANDTNRVRVSSSTETTWTDTTVTANVTYYYRLISFDSAAYVNHSFFTDTKQTRATAAKASIDTIVPVSGNHQLGSVSARLSSPLKVKVSDSTGNAIAYAPCTFTISYPSSGSSAYLDSASTVTKVKVFADTEGIASETLTLGTVRGVYMVTVTSDSAPAKQALLFAYADGVDISATTWKMVTPNKALSSASFSGLTSELSSPTGYAWKEDAGVSAGLSEYNSLSSSSSAERGRAYWVYSTAAGTITQSGTSGFDTVQVALTAGWHMIGSGQYFYVDWDSGIAFDTNGTKYNPAASDSKGIIKNAVYWYSGSGYYWGPDPSTAQLSRIQMKPVVGFWVFTKVACTMTVYPNPVGPADTSSLILAQAPAYADNDIHSELIQSMAATYVGGRSDQDWLVRLSAVSGSQVDFQNYVGAKPNPEEADRAGRYDPPAAAGRYVSLGIIDADGSRRAASYVAPISTVKTWTLTLATNLDTALFLSWENVASVPTKYAAYLIGGPAGPVDLRRQSSMIVSPGGYTTGTLTMAVGLPEYLAAFLAPALDKTQTFVYPNPGPDGATGSMTFKYNLQSAADVTLRIFDVGGRLVREFRQTGNPGSNTLTWDTTNKQGQRIGSGVYIYILQSGSSKLVDKLGVVR